jgi:hypothetical protein
MIYETADELFAALSEPFPSEDIEWRVGPTNAKSKKADDPAKGQPLLYINARTVMDRLDAVCGLDGWQCNYTVGLNGSMICNIGVKMPDGSWVWKADAAGETDMEGEKGAASDALKRAAVRFGVGRYLYEIKHPWIELDDKFRLTNAAREKLVIFYEDYGARQAGWGSRAGGQVYRLLTKVVKDYVTDTATAQEFKTKNKGEIALLPVKMKRHLDESLDRVGATQTEAAE